MFCSQTPTLVSPFEIVKIVLNLLHSIHGLDGVKLVENQHFVWQAALLFAFKLPS